MRRGNDRPPILSPIIRWLSGYNVVYTMCWRHNLLLFMSGLSSLLFCTILYLRQKENMRSLKKIDTVFLLVCKAYQEIIWLILGSSIRLDWWEHQVVSDEPWKVFLWYVDRRKSKHPCHENNANCTVFMKLPYELFYSESRSMWAGCEMWWQIVNKTLSSWAGLPSNK